MKKRMITLGCLLTLVCTMFAQDLVFKMTEESGVEIVNGGRFDLINKCIGSTAPGSTICLGEIDFEDGIYNACGVEIAHENLETNGMIEFYLGHPDEGGILFTDVEIKGTGAFQYYRTFIYNFYPEGTEGYTFPTGKGKVYIRFNDCEGNVKKVMFYKEAFDEEKMGEQKDPTYISQKIAAKDGSVTDSEKFPEVKLNDDGAWGWTAEELIVKFPNIDFKSNGLYKQIAVVSSHGGTNVDGFLLLYVDDPANEDNLIAKIWTSRDFGWRVYGTLAKNLTKEISGTHDLYVKWTAPTNLKEIQLIEGTPWVIEDDEPENVELIDEPISDNAYGMHFDSQGGIENTVDFMASGSDDLKFEGSNIGYTSRGVVLKFNAVDFKTGEFTRILVDHSSDQVSLGKSVFNFYLDLTHEDYSDLSILEQDTKLATVKAQGTSNWATPKKTAGTLSSKVTGVHDLYMVLDIESGTNIYGVYLDTDYTSSIDQTLSEGIKVWGENEKIVIKSVQESGIVSVYNLVGNQIAVSTVTAGETTIHISKGIYVVKINGNACKVSVN